MTNRAVWSVLALASIGGLIGSAPAVAQPGPPERTGITLPEHRNRGQAAIDALGTRLPEVARWYGMTPTHLEHLFRTDLTLHADKSGRLFHVEDKPALPPTPPAAASGKRTVAGTTAAAGAPTASGATIPLDQTFKLHSKPGSSRTLYLDFNGHVATGTVWNSSYGISTITNPAFDLDGNPSTFNDAELTAIQQAWQRVSEDYAAFDVNVTTEEPPASALDKSSSTDTVYGWRAVITRDFTKSTASPCSCGGFSYIGVVGQSAYSPSYVFFDQLASNERYIAEAISHEVGHALGLNHDGTSTQNYYTGQGSGVDGWAPIMGVGYYANVTQWSKGEYPDANNKQDDIAIIAQNFPLRADDVPDTYAQAASLASVVANGVQTLSASGLIGTANDVDVFTFYAGAGAVSFNVVGGDRGQNTDLLAELRDASGNILASARPADSLNAAIAFNVAAAGQFYLVVTSTNAQDGSGSFSEYASVGRYAIAGTAPAASGLIAPVAVATSTTATGTAPLAVNFSGSGSSDADGSIVSYTWDFGDGSATASGPTASHAYANAGSYNATLRVTDNSGLSASTTVPITVTQTAIAPTVMVSSMTMTVRKNRKQGTDITVNVTVKDGNGVVVPSATVTGAWSGSVTGSGSALTSSTGVASIRSSRTMSTTGTATFTVQGVAVSGYTYAPAKNVESVDTVSW